MREIEKYKLGDNDSKMLSEQIVTVNGSRQDRAIVVCDPRSDAYFIGVFDGFDKYC